VKWARPAIIIALILTVARAGGVHNPGQAPPSTAKTIELPPDSSMGTLKPGPGLDVVESNCAACHSTDYIVRQPGGDAKHWEPEIRKMIAVYGLRLTDADVQTIVNYLAAEYGAPPSAETGEPTRVRTGQPSPGQSVH
jgi:sulfite dehydrogenase (cytochrome) subunit B